jgi:hypothetical protein
MSAAEATFRAGLLDSALRTASHGARVPG